MCKVLLSSAVALVLGPPAFAADNTAWTNQAKEHQFPVSFLDKSNEAEPGFATGVATSTLGIGGSRVVVTVTALCLAASPQIYISGSLRLLPPSCVPGDARSSKGARSGRDG